MPDEPFAAAKSGAAKSASILQINRPGEEAPLQFPAVIRNLAAGVATLEVNNPWTILNWETLKGQGGRLRLLSETGEVTDLAGIINWARYSVQGQDSGNLNLSLKLTESGLAVQKLLSEFIPHTAKDIKGFWDRWEETQAVRASEPSSFTARNGLAALVLLFAGLVLQLSGAMGFKIFGLMLWCGGTLVVALQALRFWKNRKDTSQ